MIEHDELAGRVLPFVRHWPVIHEIDLARLIADHASLRVVCDELEACADALPDRPCNADADAICLNLRRIVVSHPREENALIDKVFERDLNDPLTAAIIGRMRARHVRDTIHADDLLAALSGASTPCGEAFGYMLRVFFEGCRQAMDFTELAMLTLGTGRLSRDARAMLVDGLCNRTAG